MKALVLALVVVACGPRDPGPAALVPVRDARLAADPINTTDLDALEREANRVLRELIAALPDHQRARVANVILTRDNSLGEVNAFATCDEHGPYVAIGDGLLAVAAHLAMSTAADELFETDLARGYLGWLGEHGLAAPPAAFYPASLHTDPRKVARQREVFDEELAYILGHELAHHYLGHVACNSHGGLEEVGQIAAAALPVINQTTELAADTAAVKNLLAAGVAREGYAWTEDGAVLILAAFDRRRPLGAKDVLLAFARSHPFPHLRIPAVTLAAELWHSSGGHLPL